MILAIALGLTGAWSCTASRDAIKDKLETSTRAYTRAMRWGDWDAAANYVPEESAVAYVERGESMREAVKVLDHELLALKYEPERGVAMARYALSFQRDREIVVRDAVLEEEWVFHEGRWYVVAQTRVSGEPFELMGESESKTKVRTFEDPVFPGKKAFLKSRKAQAKANNEHKAKAR